MATSICLVGCGGIAEAHAQAYAKLQERAEVFVHDVDNEAAQNLCSRHGFRGVLSSFDEILDSREIAAVDICVPHDQHVPVAVACAEASKQILLEKPIARTLEEADRIIAAVERAGVILMIAENYRFHPPVVTAKRLVAEGAIGDTTIVQANSWQHHVPGGWRRSKEKCGGGALMDRGIHFVDIALNFGGSVDTLFALRPPQVIAEMEGEDSALILMKHHRGTVGEVNVTWGTPGAPQGPWFTVCGNEGCLYDQDGLWLHRKGEEPTQIPTEPEDATLVHQMAHFLDCVQHGAGPLVTGEVGREALRLVLAAYESMETGRAVELCRGPV